MTAAVLEVLSKGLPLEPLPPARKRDEDLPHAPVRSHSLTASEQRVSIGTAVSTFAERASKLKC
jgi:urocanate hydratase